MIKGYVYILTNPSMPGLVKIGKTCRDVEQRMNELDSTGVPTPFEVYFSIISPNCHVLETAIHQCLEHVRVRQGREFFAIEANEAEKVLSELHTAQVEEWLQEFMPDHVIVGMDEFIDVGGFDASVYETMRREGIVYPDMVSVLYRLRGQDLEGAISRFHARREEERRRNEVNMAALQ